MTNADTLFRALADPTRLRLLTLLIRQGELCVCELTHALGLSQPKISRHLAHLREGGVVLDRRQGLWVFYRIHPELPAWMAEVMRLTGEAMAGQQPFVADANALAGMAQRPERGCC